MIRLKTIYAGPKGVKQPGDVLEVTAEIAAEMISGGYAIPFSKPIETATAEPEERAVTVAPKRRGRPRKTT